MEPALKPVHVAQLRNLYRALSYKGRAGQNNCVQRSVALALDVRSGVVTFGTLRAATPAERAVLGPTASPVPFIHCWVEVSDVVLAPTTIERTGGLLLPMSRDAYYAVNGVKDVRPVPSKAFDDIVRRHRLVAALKHGSPRFGSGAVTEELLAAAGVQYVLSERLSLLPA